MSGRASLNNLKAGAFLLISLAGGMIIAMKLGDVYGMLTEKRAKYVVRFSLADGAMGLKKGSMVKVGGQEMGKVENVGFKKPDGATVVDANQAQSVPFKRAPTPDPNDGWLAPDAVYVTISIKAEIRLYKDAKVYLELPLLGTVSTINIPDVGGENYNVPAGDAAAVRVAQVEPLTEKDIIPGTLAPPTFLGQAGYGADQKEQLQIILQRGKEIATQMSELVGTTRGALDDTLGSLKQAADNVNQATGSVNKKLPDWVELISKTLANFTGASGQAEQRLIEARALIATVRSTIEDNRAYLDKIFSNTATATENVADLTHKLNTDLYQTVKDTLVDGRKTMTRFADLGDRAGQFLTEKTPELSRIVANARLASDQLKLAMTEVRRNPWRLLYQPTRRELEEELTYDAARTYADAVGQLRAASEALEAVVASGAAATPEQRQRMVQINEDIKGAFERYREAERKFLERLTK